MKHVALAVLLLLGAAGSGHTQTISYGDTIVEIVGLERWSVREVESAVRRFRPDISLASAACAVILRDSIGFADAAVASWTDGRSPNVLVQLLVVEPEKRHLIAYTSEGRSDIPPPAAWQDVVEELAADASAFGYLQHPEVLIDGSEAFAGLSVPESALALREVIRRHNSDEDLVLAENIVRRSSNLQSRQLAALILSNFATEDRAWHALAEGMRAGSGHAAVAAQMIFGALSRSGRFEVDWAAAEPALRALVGGTHLAAYGNVLAGLTATGIDSELAGRLADVNPELLRAAAAANSPMLREPARAFLQHAGRGEPL